MARKNCKQVDIPVVDNSKDECEFFVGSACVAVDRKSTLINNVPGRDLNEYFEMLENYIKKKDARIQWLEQQVAILIQNNQQPDGIGVFDPIP